MDDKGRGGCWALCHRGAKRPRGGGLSPLLSLSLEAARAIEKLSSVTNYGPSFMLMAVACFCPMLWLAIGEPEQEIEDPTTPETPSCSCPEGGVTLNSSGHQGKTPPISQPYLWLGILSSGGREQSDGNRETMSFASDPRVRSQVPSRKPGLLR